MEEPTSDGPTDRASRDPDADSNDVGRESALGAPRIHGELLKLGFTISQTTVAKYMARHKPRPSQTWRTFLANHVQQLIAADFFVVQTATCRLLFVLVLLAHERRRVVHVAVTDHPSAAWTVQQLRDAFPWDEASRYLIRDRDHAFDGVHASAKAMGIHEVLTAPRSPWQNAYVERFIGSVRRECLDHVIVLTAPGLGRILKAYVAYYNGHRPHRALGPYAALVPRSHSARICRVHHASRSPRWRNSRVRPCGVTGFMHPSRRP